MTKTNDNGINRDMTAEEKAQYDEWAATAQAEDAQIKAQIKAKEEARAAVLAKLGLTADEAAALLG
jgi:hypothetical protein